MKKRGSAIVISMLLITAISVIAFGVAKMIYAGSQTVQMYENGAVAYYSAESGVEEAFLRYRYNQNAQVPATNFEINQESYLKTTYHDIGGRTGFIPSVLTSNGTGADIDSLHQTYDLRMGGLGTQGQDGIQSYGSFSIKRGEAVKINMTGLVLQGSDLDNLRFEGKFENNFPAYPTGDLNIDNVTLCKSLVEVKFSYLKDNIPYEHTELIKPDLPENCDGLQNVDTKGVKNTNGRTMTSGSEWGRPLITRLQDVFYKNGGNPPDNSKLTLTIKPLYFDLTVKLIKSKCLNPTACTTVSDVPSGPFTYIQSTGYFGGIAKKIKANIDRQSGSLYDLYDYVIYTNN